MKCSGALVLALALLAASASAGCQDDLTEVLVIIDSDVPVGPGRMVDQVVFTAQAGGGSPAMFSPCSFSPNNINGFPVSMAFVSGGSTTVFSVRIDLVQSINPQQPVISRTLSNIRFVADQLRMLPVEMNAVCACDGTSCPNPGTFPECDGVNNPATIPFDPEIAPPAGFPAGCSTANGGFVGGGFVRTPADAPTTAPPPQ
jgi:hypothetical protein